MSVPSLGDKLALAGLLAPYLDGRETPLADELADRGHIGLLNDPDFRRLLEERAVRCPDCGTWHALLDGEGPDAACPECATNDWEYL